MRVSTGRFKTRDEQNCAQQWSEAEARKITVTSIIISAFVYTTITTATV